MAQLSPRQAKIYKRLQAFWQRSGQLPELADLARSLKIDYTTLRQHLQALDKKGYVRFESRGVGRSPRLSLLKTPAGVPLIGSIPAGPLSEALEHPEGYVALKGKSAFFALRVQGDSMADLIQDGDVVLLEKSTRPRPGEICAVRFEQSDVTLKYLDWSSEKPEIVTLRPHNPLFPTLSLNSRDVYIAGVYRGLLRGDVIGLLYQEE